MTTDVNNIIILKSKDKIKILAYMPLHFSGLIKKVNKNKR